MKPVRLTIIGLAILCIAQLLPYGRDHTNPPVTSEPRWDSDGTRALFYRACRDCHSNETIWPWYSHVAPVSWLVRHDVDEGRSHLNVSEWDSQRQNGDEAADMVRTGEMPPWFYSPLHTSSRFSAEELEQFIAGLEATFGTENGSQD